VGCAVDFILDGYPLLIYVMSNSMTEHTRQQFSSRNLNTSSILPRDSSLTKHDVGVVWQILTDVSLKHYATSRKAAR
jgi:hypothetical protein